MARREKLNCKLTTTSRSNIAKFADFSKKITQEGKSLSKLILLK
jgi:hypothetical protein